MLKLQGGPHIVLAIEAVYLFVLKRTVYRLVLTHLVVASANLNRGTVVCGMRWIKLNDINYVVHAPTDALTYTVRYTIFYDAVIAHCQWLSVLCCVINQHYCY